MLATLQRSSIGRIVFVFALAVIGFPLAAGLLFGDSRSRIESPSPPAYSAVAYPEDFESRFVHYASVQRPDGTIRDLYISPNALATSSLPFNTVIVIVNHYAKSNNDGQFITDELGRYIRDEAAPMIHVREKRSDWLPADFVSELRSGDWNFGSFDTVTGEPFEESIAACFNCHNASRQPEFLFSHDLLSAYRASGATQYIICEFTGRTECSVRS
ncbi:MAG: cytochrome P460 family protein [Anaerolineae bacterium]|nr:cytochrome P460 family protein [Anaerolineae bacterium]